MAKEEQVGWLGDRKEFDMERLPGNPRMTETVERFLGRQRKFISSLQFPPGTKFECIGCGDCCRWNYVMLNTDLELTEKLRERAKYPHGPWTLISDVGEEGRIRVEMPGFMFIGNIPPDQTEFIIRTGRRWGYWTLNARDKVVLYNPTPCIHHGEDSKCRIYEDRPRVCRVYFCGRHPIIP